MTDWTVDTLHEHMCKVFELTRADIDDRFEAMERATTRALASAEKAVEKTERLADIRADVQDRMAADRSKAQNEWRTSLQDMTGTYVPRHEWDTAHTVLADKLAALERRHEADLTDVRSNLSESKGRGVGQNAVVLWLFIGLTACISIAAIILDLSVPH
jgi:multidrug resistance efflux pump